MSQSEHPAKQTEDRHPETGLRERVRERMRQMAPLALLAATPLTNAACDSAQAAVQSPDLPTPTCEKSPSEWRQFIGVQAAWGTEAGERIILLTVSNPSDKPWLQAPGSYTVEGGTLLPSTEHEPNVVRIKPDADASVIRLRGTMTCHVISEPMVITIDHLSNKSPTVVIEN